jgi:hypothetical protein
MTSDYRDGGKGDKPRPFSVDLSKFSENFEAIFGKKKQATLEEVDEGVYVIEISDRKETND